MSNRHWLRKGIDSGNPNNRWVDDAAGDSIPQDPSQKLGTDILRDGFRASGNVCHGGRLLTSVTCRRVGGTLYAARLRRSHQPPHYCRCQLPAWSAGVATIVLSL